MLTKKKAIALTRQSESIVYSSIEDIAQLIQLHAELGMEEMEVFVEKKQLPKITRTLNKKNYYYKVTNFEALENESRLYVCWMSSLYFKRFL